MKISLGIEKSDIMRSVKRKKDFASFQMQRSTKAEPIKYEDGNNWRILDLRPDGCDCIPLLAKKPNCLQ